MDKKVTIEGLSKLDQTRAEMAAAMAAMKHITDDQQRGDIGGSDRDHADNLIPDRIETGRGDPRMTCETRGSDGVVHQHVDISGKQTQKHRVPVDISEPVLFACSGEGILEVSLYVGNMLLSTTRPTTPVQSPDGKTLYMIDFLGKPLRGDLVPRSLQIIVEFIVETDDLPTLALLEMNVAPVSFTDGMYKETVITHGKSGPVEMTLVYTPGVVGFLPT